MFFFGCNRDAPNDRDELGETSPSFEDLSSFDRYGKYGDKLTLGEVKYFSMGQKNLDIRDAGVRLTKAAFIFCRHTAEPSVERFKLKGKKYIEEERQALIARGMTAQEADLHIEKFILRRLFFDYKVSKVYYVDYPFVLRKRLSDDWDGKITARHEVELQEEEMDWLFSIKKMVDWGIPFKDVEFRCLTEGLGLHPEAKRRLEKNGYFKKVRSLARK